MLLTHRDSGSQKGGFRDDIHIFFREPLVIILAMKIMPRFFLAEGATALQSILVDGSKFSPDLKRKLSARSKLGRTAWWIISDNSTPRL
mmetsp:Transcript_1861/g.2930  ORF Transcript_1861/g.2930 Transcript_1861/m.2930 type:complete len:89 (+) Transcript_1861:158-424(+)